MKKFAISLILCCLTLFPGLLFGQGEQGAKGAFRVERELIEGTIKIIAPKDTSGKALADVYQLEIALYTDDGELVSVSDPVMLDRLPKRLGEGNWWVLGAIATCFLLLVAALTFFLFGKNRVEAAWSAIGSRDLNGRSSTPPVLLMRANEPANGAAQIAEVEAG